MSTDEQAKACSTSALAAFEKRVWRLQPGGNHDHKQDEQGHQRRQASDDQVVVLGVRSGQYLREDDDGDREQGPRHSQQHQRATGVRRHMPIIMLQALGCARSYTAIRSVSETCVYFCVVESRAWPSNSWMARRSAPSASR